ncbi:MAG: Holliday junction branch migration protein RuvA [Rhodocyclaceae bacterium]|nr:Holliday junction branch migration protein RuvA [Rhodocyclaceae bacterium]
MIGRLHGRLLAKHPPSILLDVNGVGYEVDVSMNTFCELPALDAPVTLHIHMAVREDGHFLYGFLTESERIAFRQLIKISGVGARMALAVLSGLNVDELAAAIARQDVACFTRIPGIGKKTAERLLLELKGKLDLTAGGNTAGHAGQSMASDPLQDTVDALVALGYNAKEAQSAIKALPAGVSTTDAIRLALKQLSGLK